MAIVINKSASNVVFYKKKIKNKSGSICTTLPSLAHNRSGRDTVKITFSWPFLCYCQISFWINTICLMYECEIYKMLDTYFINTMSLQNVNSIVLLYYKFLFTQIFFWKCLVMNEAMVKIAAVVCIRFLGEN